MIRFWVTLFLCFCATSAFATFEIIDPASISDSDDFDSTSGGTKPTILTDQDEATYIFMAGAVGTDRYNLEDLANDDHDEIDSVIIYYKAQDDGGGNNRVQFAARINTDITSGTENNLTTGWVDYSDSHTTPPGSRGTWDDFEVDSLVVQIAVTAINGAREARVAECSVVVFYKSTNRTLMFPAKDDACLTGTNFDHDLLRKSAMQNDTAFVFVDDAAGTANDYWKTGNASTNYHKINNDDWETGGFGVFFDVVLVKADCSLDVRIIRYNSSCVLQEATPIAPAVGTAKLLVDTTGHYEIQIPQHDWSSGACGDELAVHFRWTNPEGQADDSVWIRYGVADTYLEHEILINGTGGCPAEQGAGDCWGQPSTDTVGTVPSQEGGKVEWFEDAGGGAGSLIAAIADAVDANYMYANDNQDTVQIQMGAISEPGDLDTYDSVTVVFTGRRNTVKKQVRVRVRVADSTNPTTQYCESGSISLAGVTWVEYDNSLTIFGAPSAANTCEGSFSTSEINGWEISFFTWGLSAGKEAWITSVDLVVCYTIAGEAGGGQVMRIQLGMKDDPLGWAEEKWWAGLEHPLYPDRGTVWGVTKDSKWEIDKCNCE